MGLLFTNISRSAHNQGEINSIDRSQFRQCEQYFICKSLFYVKSFRKSDEECMVGGEDYQTPPVVQTTNGCVQFTSQSIF